MSGKIPEETKLAVMGRIHAGVPLRMLVEEFQIPYPRLLAYRKELNEARTAGLVHTLVNVDEIIVESIAHQVEQDMALLAPGEQEQIKSVVGEVVEGAKGLNVLDTRLQTTALEAANKLNSLAQNSEGVKELNAVIDGLCKIQQAFFNRGNTVNIQNNLNGESSGFKKFLKD